MKVITIYLSGILLAAFLSGCSQTTQPGTVGNGTENQSASTQPDKAVSTSQQVLSGTKSGVISDSMCGANHAGMLKTESMGKDDASCTVKCVEAGSHFVLVDTETGKVYRLTDQVKPKEFAGKKVTVTGQINEGTRSIKVETVTPAS